MLFNISGEKYLLIYHNVHVRIIALEVHTTITGFHKNNSITFIFIAMNIKVIELFLWNPVIVVCTSSAIILTWTLWYMRRYFSPDILNNNIRYLNAHKCLDPKSYK